MKLYMFFTYSNHKKCCKFNELMIHSIRLIQNYYSNLLIKSKSKNVDNTTFLDLLFDKNRSKQEAYEPEVAMITCYSAYPETPK